MKYSELRKKLKGIEIPEPRNNWAQIESQLFSVPAKPQLLLFKRTWALGLALGVLAVFWGWQLTESMRYEYTLHGYVDELVSWIE